MRRYSTFASERFLDAIDRRRLLGLFAFLPLQTDQHVVRRAELLQADLSEIEAAEGLPHRRDIGRTFGLDVEQYATAEVDSEIQTVEQDKQDRGDDDKRRESQEQLVESHKRHPRAGGYELKAAHRLAPQIARARGRYRRSQATTISRVKVTAVNIEAMMPIPSVTANPRTGPEPNR